MERSLILVFNLGSVLQMLILWALYEWGYDGHLYQLDKNHSFKMKIFSDSFSLS